MPDLMERDTELRPAGGGGLPDRLAKYEVVAVIVHDLRSPLWVIRNALQVLHLTRPSASRTSS